ncbi:MAG: S9 family peptidase [Verrucomicrobia bacterium]|nr:S9 family peptidase [Verrucomicrobiota bacterium]
MISRLTAFVRTVLLVACSVYCVLTVGAAPTPTIDQLLSLKSVARPRLSPDGKLVAYEVTETDWKENAYVTQLWLADVPSGRSVQLTRGKKSSDNAQWSPDGRWLAFLTERETGAVAPLPEKDKDKGDKPTAEAKPAARQLWLISPLGGEAWALTRHGTTIEAFRWSEDGRQIAFTAPVPETKEFKARKEKYSDYEVFEEDFDQNQLWSLDLAAAEKTGLPVEAKAVTSDPKVNVTTFAWSPDGQRIVFAGTANPLLGFSSTSDLYLVDLGGAKTVTKVVALDAPDTAPAFSPDGTELIFTTSLARPYRSFMNRHLATVRVDTVLKSPAKTPANVRDLTAAFDEDPTLVEWTPVGIFFRGQQKTSGHLFVLAPSAPAPRRVTSPDVFGLTDASLSRDGRLVAFVSSDATHLPEIYVAPVPAAGATFAPRQLTAMSDQLSGSTVGSVELVSWQSKDGTTIEGVLHKPANFDAAKKYPLLVMIHGGPTGISRPVLAPAQRYYPIEQFLAKGALVLEPNYRGSAGYGEKFRALNARNLGVGDMWDVMSGIDALIARGLVDETKLGSMGWSQGGYISAFLTTNTDRFKAISVGAGISNWMTYYVNTDITPFTRHYLDATPWDDPAIYAKTSPMTTIKQAKTPTLIQHGDRDKRVPPPNAYELYRGLRDVGVTTRLILYAGFGHPINKPKSNRAVLEHNLDWFSHYLFGDPIPKDSALHGRGATP